MGLAIGGAILAALLLWPGAAERRALEKTRQRLRREGFKIDLTEFNFSTSPEMRLREAALTNADPVTSRRMDSEAGRRFQLRDRIDLMKPVSSDAAVVFWRLKQLPATTWSVETLEDFWPSLREIMNADQPLLDAACDAALRGPIAFNLEASHGAAMLLRHLAVLRNLTSTLAARTMLELHDGNRDAAWTNLLALTRLVTAWNPEPVETSLMVRYICATTAYNATWQALQTNGWTDEQLAQLQREWASVDWFGGLPEAAAAERASVADALQRERREPALAPGLQFGMIVQSPGQAWGVLKDYWNRLQYKRHDSYEDEQAVLVYYRDREIELRRAIQAPNWLQMSQLPGVTNAPPFTAKGRYASRTMAMLNLRRVGLAFTGRGLRAPARAAEAETRRRLLVMSLALERHRLRHGTYPDRLEGLAPELLPDINHAGKTPARRLPLDFINGQPLHYRLGGDSRFVLYSVGLDGVDDGGEMRRPQQRARSPEGLYAADSGTDEFGVPHGTDLVWPRPASAAQIQADQQAREERLASVQAARDAQWARMDRARETQRQAVVQKLLEGTGLPPRNRDPIFLNQPLRKLLQTADGTNTFDELMTLRQVATGEEPGTVSFELPVNYDAVDRLGRMHLLVDGGLDTASMEEVGERQTCQRATNGNCLLRWTSSYDPPGKHALQAEFIGTKNPQREEDAQKFQGPMLALTSTNICQFDFAYDHFTPRGATLFARLPESNAVFRIALKDPAGELINTIQGTTSNGVIRVNWDLLDSHGRRYTNSSFDTVFEVTLPDSGRSQVQNGP